MFTIKIFKPATFIIFVLMFICITPLTTKIFAQINDSTNNKTNTINREKSSASVGNFSGTIIPDVVYGNAINYKGSNEPLTLDIYKPANAGEKKFPVVMLIHGGSFVGGNKNSLASTCSKLANGGYVVVSINYRLGWGFVSKATATCNDTIKLKQAMYRAIQDAHTALNFIAAHANEYNIDKNWMFIGGQSSGAITALSTAYLKEKDATIFFDRNSEHEQGILFNSDTTYKLKGVISMWGAFLNPELITKETALPTIFFQGQLDRGVAFDVRPFVPCNSASLSYGTKPLYNRLKSLDETVVAHVDPQGGHGVFEEDFRVKNIICFLNDVRQGIKKQAYILGVENNCGK